MARSSTHPTSFICERSAEFALTRRLADLLRVPFPNALFLQFCGTREGSRIARLCMDSTPIRLGLVFARRPKIRKPGDDVVLIKINSELFDSAAVAQGHGMTVLAGAPIINTLLDLSRFDRCSWFQLSGTSAANGDCEIHIATADGSLLSTLPPSVTGPLSDDNVINRLVSNMLFNCWEEACDAIMDVKRAIPSGPYGGTYRPFVVVIPELKK